MRGSAQPIDVEATRFYAATDAAKFLKSEKLDPGKAAAVTDVKFISAFLCGNQLSPGAGETNQVKGIAAVAILMLIQFSVYG